MSDILMLFMGGFLAGTLGGFLGIGGGIVLMPMLRFLVGLSPANAAGTCVLAVFFTTLGGSYRHYKLGNINLRSVTPIMISGAIATAIFSYGFLYLSTRERWLDLGMGLVFALISLRMIAEGIPGLIKKYENNNSNEINGPLIHKISIGSIAGVLPGLLGIGTGVILVPAFIYILNAPIKLAMASSLTCFSVNALISSGFKYWQGFIDLNVAIPICLGTLLGANMGATLNKRTSSKVLKLVFGLVFSYVALKFFLSFMS
ncbi:sulfite exporter TauE/SafE family protein [bacterium]|nr:sulfite exporter TauE/SafE family protein [bacterium]MBU1651094.1 sulfite exporter TauE/SafE family protein [bacterium]